MRFTAIMFAAIIALGLATFNACAGDNASTTSTSSTSEASASDQTASGLHIVYIDADSLQRGFTALRTELDQLEENYAAAEANHQSRVRSLQNEVQSLQNRVQRGELSQNRIAQEQQRISVREQEILQQQQIAINAIQEKQLQLNAQFTTQVEDILETLKAENNYDFVFNVGGGSGLLLANDAYDITALVLDRLNADAEVSIEEDDVE